MKYWILTSLLMLVSLCASAQDKIVLKDGTTLDVKVLESNDRCVVFVYPNEEVRNEKAKRYIDYIVYSSGRKEVCHSVEIPTIKGEEDWEKVIVTTNKDDVFGLTKVELVSGTYGNGFTKADKAHVKAMEMLKRKVAKLKCGIVLQTGESFGGRYNNISTITGEVYK